MDQLHRDQNVVLGVLAWQTNLVTREALARALCEWSSDKSTSLGRILTEQGSLSTEERHLLEGLAEKHAQRHDNDPDSSLTALLSVTSASEVLEQLTESELGADRFFRRGVDSGDPYATVALPLSSAPLSVGTTTTSGARFHILAPHARGGLGEVFRALDTELHREVALKRIQERSVHDSISRSRFLLEAEITGRLEHPGVVPVYGLGASADGRPYYVMRFIRGESLKEAIERFHRAPSLGNLELRQLLVRMMNVCDAVAFAHSRGVLHRDIKPGNIMLGPFGETLVVDWGLAKLFKDGASGTEAGEPLLAAELDQGDLATQAGCAVGTPPFMSPEQAGGRLELMGPSSDVYSLGATLYSLLTGKLAFPGRNSAEVLGKVQSGDFSRPRELNARIPRPIEAICLKAMAHQPADRYASAADLKADIEHWLADEPVAAYPERISERLTRWTRKHRGATRAAAAALLVIALISVLAAVLIDGQRRRADASARVATQERNAAQAAREASEIERRKATQWGGVANHQRDLTLNVLSLLMFDLQTRLSDRPGTQKLQEELLSRAVDGLEQMTETFDSGWQWRPLTEDQAGIDAESQRGIVDGFIEGQRWSTEFTKAIALARLGDILFSAGRTQEAGRLYEQGHAMLLVLHDDPEHPDRHKIVGQILSMSYDRLGKLEDRLGNAAAATGHYTAALELREAWATAHPDEAGAWRGLATSYSHLGDIQSGQSAWPAAYDWYRRALKLYETASRIEPLETDSTWLSNVEEELGGLSLRMGNAALARDYQLQALARREADAAADPGSARRSRAVGASYLSLGNALVRLGEFEAARDYFRKALADREALAAEDPMSLQAQRSLAVAHNRLGHVSHELGDIDTARTSFRRDVELSEKLAAADPTNAHAQMALAAAYSSLAMVELKQLNFAEGTRYSALSAAINVKVRALGQSTYEPTLPNWAENAMQVIDPRRTALVQNDGLPANFPPRFAKELLLLRATVAAGERDHAAAAQAAESLRALSADDVEALYDTARCFALAAESLQRGSTEPAAPAKGPAVTEYQQRAVDSLHEAASLGFDNWQRIETDPDLESLRQNAAYRKFVERIKSQAR